MKKSRLIILLLVMVSLMTTTVFADSSASKIRNNTYADKLKELGIFSGTENGYELEKGLPRIQGAVMLVRILGKEDEALKKNEAHPFDDVPVWANAYVGYLYTNGLSDGLSKDKYGADEAMSGNQFMTLLLRALEFKDSEGDFVWDNALVKAIELRILTEEEVKVIQFKENFLRDDMVLLAYKALEAKYKNKETTLGENLYETGVFSKKSIKNVQLKGVIEKLGVSVKIEKGSKKDTYIIEVPKDKLDGAQKTFAYMDVIDKLVSLSDDEIYEIAANKNFPEIIQKKEYKLSDKNIIILYDQDGNPIGTSDVFSQENTIEDAVVVDFVEFNMESYKEKFEQKMLSVQKFEKPLVSFSIEGIITIDTDENIKDADKVVLAEVDRNWNANMQNFIEASVIVKTKAQNSMSLPLNAEASVISIKDYMLKDLTDQTMAFVISVDKEILGYSEISQGDYENYKAYEKVDKNIVYLKNALFILEHQYANSKDYTGHLNVGEIDLNYDEYTVHPLASFSDIPLFLTRPASSSYPMAKKDNFGFYAPNDEEAVGYLALFVKEEKTVAYSYVSKEMYEKDRSKYKEMSITFDSPVTEDLIEDYLKFEVSYNGKVVSVTRFGNLFQGYSGTDTSVIRNITVFDFVSRDGKYTYKPIGSDELVIKSFKIKTNSNY